MNIKAFFFRSSIIVLVISSICFTSCSSKRVNIKPSPEYTQAKKHQSEKRAPALSSIFSSPSGEKSLESGEENYSDTDEKEKEEGKDDTFKSIFKSSDPAETQSPNEQEILDSALEFVQASYDFWERGELDNALDALDQAYALILKVKPDNNPKILQQREDLRFTISKRIMAVYRSRASAVNGNHKEIPLVMNEHVEKALKLFQGKERQFFMDAYQLSGRYRPFIVQELKKAGLPEELSWLPLIESGFKLRALSRARALGMWQFIASTGYKFGLKRDRWVDERMDPEKSTRAAIEYLKELHQIFGDWTTDLAAYNCGEGNVLRRIRTQKMNYLDNFWDLYIKLPIETAFYVPKFLAVLHIVNDPEKHGFKLPTPDSPVETEKVTIAKQVQLKEVAKALGIGFHTLKDLNPELRYHATPKRAYALKVPKGKDKDLLAKLDSIPEWKPPKITYVRHRVRRGQTLSTIARRYRTSTRAIMRLNGLRSSRFIRTGWVLKIPAGRRHVPPASVSSSPPPSGYHIVRRGETLSTIARKYGTTTKSLLAENHLSSRNIIRTGQKLKIISGKKYITPRKALPKRRWRAQPRPRTYVVRKGDSLWTLAKTFGTTAENIRALNKLEDENLKVGQVLVISRMPDDLKGITTSTYTVLKGDSPYTIATKHQMDLSELLRLNNLTPRSKIFPGQVLLVKAQ
jgi:membrane-bound lytic murein transglycosylase D